jgi:hypothetical protein
MDVDGNPPTVIDDRDAIVGMDKDINTVTVSGERFVNAVIDYLKDKVMKSGNPSVSYVHGGSFPDGFKTLEDLNLGGVILKILLVH